MQRKFADKLKRSLRPTVCPKCPLKSLVVNTMSVTRPGVVLSVVVSTLLSNARTTSNVAPVALPAEKWHVNAKSADPAAVTVGPISCGTDAFGAKA